MSKKPSKKKPTKFWNFYQPDDSAPELSIYGAITAEKSWWEDPENQVTHKEFAKELNALGDVSEIVVRINSGGGSVTAANAIYTRLKDHKAKIVVKIDGYAASAATTIAMAGDVIQIPENAYFMVHNPSMQIYGSLTKEKCTELASTLDTIKNGIISTYKARTGMSEEEISDIMNAETWYTGKQAVEAGFCDEIMFSDVETTAENGESFAINSVSLNPEDYINIPKELLDRFAQAEEPVEQAKDFTNIVPKTKENMEVEEKDMKNVEELKNKYPELYATIVEEAKMAERQRIQNIEEIAVAGYEQIVEDAKFKSGAFAGDVAIQMMALQKKQGGRYLEDRGEDAEASNAGKEGIATPMETAENATAKNDALDVVNKVLDDVSGNQ
ncbi:MAG: Clp protease ClpP [Eubacteriales bacterium]